jgi:tungstate transport system substrate-binding protein
MRRGLGLLPALLLVVTVAAGCAPAATALPAQPRLRVATTTSLYDTGLWGYLEPMFEREHGIELDVLSAGTGKALEYGRRGDVQAVTVHSRDQEEAFIAAGHGAGRVPFAYNHFIIVGPPDDPAGISGLSPADAFSRLADSARTPFVSRGDDSGTHHREQALWALAGMDYESVRGQGAWYVEGGAGMGPILTMANEKLAYTLTDIGTFLSYRSRLDLVPLVEEGEGLLNVYSAIAVTSENSTEEDRELGAKMLGFLVSEAVQDLIGRYGVGEYGRPLFIPCAGNEPKPEDGAVP